MSNSFLDPNTGRPIKGVDPNTGRLNNSAYLRETPRSKAFAAQAEIRKLEMQLADLQGKYAQGQARGMQPSMLASLQSQISSLQSQINNMKQSARMDLSIAALEAQQLARGRGSVGVSNRGGRGGIPNQTDINRSQLYQLLASMFDAGMGSRGMW